MKDEIWDGNRNLAGTREALGVMADGEESPRDRRHDLHVWAGRWESTTTPLLFPGRRFPSQTRVGY